MALVIAWGTSVVVAALIQRHGVPRIHGVQVDEGDPPPDFAQLGRWAHVTAVAFLTAVAGSALLAAQPRLLWAWAAYVAFGAPLVYVDLRTTYLPNRLMHPLWAALAAGLIVAAVGEPWLLARAAAGAAAGFGLLWCVWRFSRNFGFGDVRLGAAVGALAGASGAVSWGYAFVLGTMLGAVVAVAAAAAGRRVIPYGPWLWAGPLLAAATGW